MPRIHTPGPWRFGVEFSSTSQQRVIYAPTGEVLAAVGPRYKAGRFDSETEANADLMAASPALADALRACLDENVEEPLTRETRAKAEAALRSAGVLP